MGGGTVDTDRLVIADGVDLCTKHYGCESEEEDGLETEEDEEQHRHPWRELTALWSEKEKETVFFILHGTKMSN